MGSDALTLSTLAPSPPTSVVSPPPAALAPGFRFHPTDEELIIYYLKRKVCGKPFRFSAISEVDIYKSEPWDLAGKSRLKSRDQEYYFFSVLDKKYGTGARMNRATNQGYWKATGIDRPVRHDSKTVGIKKALVFHSGKTQDGKRTNWVMHEYTLVEESSEQSGAGAGRDGYVLCRVFHKSNIGPSNGHPFIEDEWADEALVPGEGAPDYTLDAHDARVEGNEDDACGKGKHCKRLKDGKDQVAFVEQAPIHAIEYQTDSHNIVYVCGNERLDNYAAPSIIANPNPNPKRFSQIEFRKRRHDDSNSDISNISENSTRVSEGLPSTTTSATVTPTVRSSTRPKTMNFLSATVEYSLLESIEPKDHPLPPQALNAVKLDSFVHPSIMKFIEDLQNEIHHLQNEIHQKETVKFELLSAQAMIGILQSRIEDLNRDNDKLKKSGGEKPRDVT